MFLDKKLKIDSINLIDTSMLKMQKGLNRNGPGYNFFK